MLFPRVDESETFEQSFDFSGCPNLQDVDFALAVGWKGRGLPWIPMALSTLRPATSPLLSAIQLHFACPIVDRGVKSLIKDTSNDLRRVATEVARIEREFGGVVKFTVSRDSLFEAVLCALNVRSRFVVLMKLVASIHLHSSLADFPAPPSLTCESVVASRSGVVSFGRRCCHQLSWTLASAPSSIPQEQEARGRTETETKEKVGCETKGKGPRYPRSSRPGF